MLVVHDGTANINKNNVINMVKCRKCKWFTGLVIQDEFEYNYGYCQAIEPEMLLSEKEAEDDLQCDLYVNNSNDDTAA